ncbi:MAG: hypothetical protein ICV69_09125 [Thermoleophilaceae bacterium]|nr:hypothetical protein [Thermoleophilaceae bacterium]
MTRADMFELSVLTALADGSLPSGRRRPIEERLASGPPSSGPQGGGAGPRQA